MAARTMMAILLALPLCACVSVVDRPSRSTLGCAQAVVRSRVPAGLADKPTHCIAAAMIARYCSSTEATLVSIGNPQQPVILNLSLTGFTDAFNSLTVPEGLLAPAAAPVAPAAPAPKPAPAPLPSLMPKN